jgi:DNA polymerase I-like protein with 3'-5' exonuclease and polymerase domains
MTATTFTNLAGVEMASKELKKINFNYEYITDQTGLGRVLEWMDRRKFFTIDFETDSVNPFTGEVVLCQIGDPEKQWILDARATNIDAVGQYTADPEKVKLGQNIGFDIKFGSRRGWKWKNVADTMISEQVLRCGIVGRKNTVSLEALARHYLRIQLDKDADLRTGWASTGIGNFSQRQLEYAAGDVIYPEYIARQQKPLIAERGLRNTISLECAVIPVIAKMELEGMRLDVDAWVELYQNSLRGRAEAEKRLEALFNVEWTQQEDFFGGAKPERNINFNSWQQVLKALHKMGHRDLDNTESDYIALQAITGYIPLELAQALISYRIYNTRVTRYGLTFLDAIEPTTQHIHSAFTQAVTHTGRLSSGEDKQAAVSVKSSKKVNLQNIPKLAAYRNCFIPDPGDVLIVWDLKAIEPRILGDMSLDPMYVDTLVHDGDIYNALGTKIYGEEVSKKPGRPTELRAKTKIGILGTSYGTGKTKFHRKMLLDLNLEEEGFLKTDLTHITRDESDELWEGIFEACPYIKESLNRSSEIANPLGSERQVWDERAAEEPARFAYNKLVKLFEKDDRLTEEDIKARAKKLINKRGYVTYSSSLNGRKRYFKIYHATWWTEGRNQPIQATAADILKTAMVDVDARIEKEGHDAAIINQVHDELVLRCKKEHAEEVSAYTKELLEAAGNKFLRVIPCLAEGGIVDRWEKD